MLLDNFLLILRMVVINHFYRTVSRLTLFFCILFLVACSETPRTLKIGTNIWVGYEPLYVARDLGLLPADKFSLIEYVSAPQVMRAIANSSIDLAALTLDEAILLESRGVNIKIILVMDYSHGADAIIGRPFLSSMTELKGKRIAVEEKAVGAYVLSRALEANNIKPSEVVIVHKLQHEIETAFLEKQADAVVTFEPTKSKLLEKGGNLLFDSREIPGEIVDVLVIRAELYQEFAETLPSLFQAWFETRAAIQNRPEITLPLLNQRLKLDQEALDHALSGVYFPDEKENHHLLNTNADKSLRQSAERVYSHLLGKDSTLREIKVEGLF